MTAPSIPLPRTAGLAARLRDAIAETVTVARNLRTSSREIARLEREGHQAGEERVIDFSLCVAEPSELAAALADAREAGFIVDDLRRADRGAATVRSSVRLGTLELSRATARLSRVARRHEGFAEIVGIAEE